MAFFLRGALVEYGSEVLGPIPNIVVFQFNPEQISRTLNMARDNDSPDTARQTESGTTGAPPTESFSITAHFSAMDDLGDDDFATRVARLFGIGPQLAALEKMAYPSAGLLSQAIGAAVDAVSGALGNDNDATEASPREDAPRLLFIWGPSRVLPVELKSMSITEQQYDPLLNPVQAQVEIGLSVATIPDSADDVIGKGALTYTNTLKEAQALLNLAKSIELAADIITF